jgi:hypothetical protein
LSAPACIQPVDVAEGQLEAYNAQDLDAFCAFYDDHVVVADLNGAVTGQGIAALRGRYEALFAQYPQNHAELMNRIVVGPTVIDHERVRRTPDGDSFDVAAIYTISDAKIVRVDFAK